MKKMTQFSLSLMMLALFAAKRGYEMDPRTGMPFNEQDVIKLNEFVEECETQKKFSKKSIRKLVKMGFEKKQVKKMCKNHNSGKYEPGPVLSPKHGGGEVMEAVTFSAMEALYQMTT